MDDCYFWCFSYFILMCLGYMWVTCDVGWLVATWFVDVFLVCLDWLRFVVLCVYGVLLDVSVVFDWFTCLFWLILVVCVVLVFVGCVCDSWFRFCWFTEFGCLCLICGFEFSVLIL